MSYMHIDNLYKDQKILLFKECYALEKIHGTSAHVTWNSGSLTVFPGAVKLATFEAALPENLKDAFVKLGHEKVTVYGEAYGGSCQGMKRVYGDKIKFVAFEVTIGDVFLAVPQAEDVATKLGFEFVPYEKISTDLAAIDAQRDRPSIQAARNGMGDNHKREGIVLRPLIELVGNDGKRIIAKHKGDEFKETATPREVDSTRLKTLEDAEAIALEWATDMRLTHVLDGRTADMTLTKEVIASMVSDIEREAAGEIVMSNEARAAIGRRTAKLLKAKCQASLSQ